MTAVNELLAKFNRNPPAEAQTITQLERVSINLPSEYKQFLRLHNGGEGFIGGAYAMLWRAEELVDLNQRYHVLEQAPGLFLFGSNGGGEAFAFDTRKQIQPIVSVPFVVMDLSAARPIASTFTQFLEALFES